LNILTCHQLSCALRANRVFGTDKKHIRTKNAVIDKNKDSTQGLYKIVANARMAFHPSVSNDPRGRLLVRAQSGRCHSANEI
jgi:hypothetical protein